MNCASKAVKSEPWWLSFSAAPLIRQRTGLLTVLEGLIVFGAVAGRHFIFRAGDEVGRVGSEKHSDWRNVVGLQPADFAAERSGARMSHACSGVGFSIGGRPVSPMVSESRFS